MMHFTMNIPLLKLEKKQLLNGTFKLHTYAISTRTITLDFTSEVYYTFAVKFTIKIVNFTLKQYEHQEKYYFLTEKKRSVMCVACSPLHLSQNARNPRNENVTRIDRGR